MKKLLALALSLLLFCGCAVKTDIPYVENEIAVPDGASIYSSIPPNEVVYDWGISLSAENVASKGLTLVCKQSGGTVSGDLSTGSFYELDVLNNGTWEAAEMLPQEYDVAWTAEAWIIPLDSETKWDVSWEWLYGELKPGTYRLSKLFMDWREPGNFDTEPLSAIFTIK